MPDTVSQILGLPYIQPSQAQKHVTHNEALEHLDILVQLAVSSRTVSTPPADPPEAARYIVPAGATGAWQDLDGSVVVAQGGAWTSIAPQRGWQAFVLDEEVYVHFKSNAWVPIEAGPELQNLDLLGVKTTADAANPLSVAGANTLLTHAGGDHRLKVNKASLGDTASLLFQSGFSGLAEMGVIGSGAFSVRVSPDGSAWTTSLDIDPTNGRGRCPQGLEVDQALTGSAVLGTVAQSGGALFEHGANANGAYLRLADGTQICTFQGTADANGDTNWTFPIAFADASTLAVNATYMGGLDAVFASLRAPSATEIGYNLWAPSGSRVAGLVGLTATGRWY